MRIALATCRRLPEPDRDEALLTRALGGEWAAWDDPTVDWGAYDLCVIRSTWNYIHHLDAFLKWARATARKTRLLNPYPVIKWNTDKAYLRRMTVPTVPTAYGKRVPKAWEEVVVKPRIGAGSFLTKKLKRSAAERFLAAQHRPMMVQPYLRSVENRGERCLVWIDGEVTHAVRKSPRFSSDDESVRLVPVARDERAFALEALKPYAKDLLYGRVDVARDANGRLVLMELELVEPSLFLEHSSKALARLAQACRKALK
jgi:glutathione synthase/RimK-type ligase-like ATP-grasp enzyme